MRYEMIKKIRLAEKGTRLLDRVTFACARAHYSRQTEKAYRYWIKAYIFFHQKQHPSQLNASHLEAFMNCLAVDRRGGGGNTSSSVKCRCLFVQVCPRHGFTLDGKLHTRQTTRTDFRSILTG